MGFFSPTKWTRKREPLPLVAACGRCGLHKTCQNPKMPADGRGERKALIVAEGPGWNEDRLGRPLCGDAGGELTTMLYEIGVNMRKDCKLYNAIICRATDHKGQNRKPTVDEVRHCRPNVAKLIEEFQPNVIIPLGGPALQSVLSLAWKDDMREFSGDGIVARWAGWQIPSVKLNTWICPTYHPSFVLRVKERNAAARRIVQNHLREAFKHDSKPYDVIPDYKKQVKVVLDPTQAVKLIRQITQAGKPTAIDYETDRLKPDHPDATILCCGLSNGDLTIAYPWTPETKLATGEFIKSKTPKIASNLQMEERWTWRHFGCGIRPWYWDQMLGAHWRNCQHGICGLKFQAFVRLGVEDYDYYLDKFRESKDGCGNSPNRLREVDMFDLCQYAGLDALFEVMVTYKQRPAEWDLRLV